MDYELSPEKTNLKQWPPAGVEWYYFDEWIAIAHGDCREILPELPKVDLVLTDPPYFEIKGSFDYKWQNFNEYLEDVERWADDIKRILKENGTLFWFGDDKNIAYTQIILDKYYGLINNLVWWKYNLRGGVYGSSGGDSVRSFPICTERILMYSNDVYNLTQCVYSIRDYIRSEIIRAKGAISLKDINKALGTATSGGGVASACLSLDKSEPAMFTREMYEKLRLWLNDKKEYEYLRKEYEDLRKEYEDLRRPFDNSLNLTEVLQFDSDTTHNMNHETVKPIELIQALILTSSRVGGLVVDPFLGSGTTAYCAKKLNRKCIGIEIEEKYCEIAARRCSQSVMRLDI